MKKLLSYSFRFSITVLNIIASAVISYFYNFKEVIISMKKNRMKKAASSLVLAAAVVFAIPTAAWANTPVTVTVKGKVVESVGNYVSANGQTYVDVAAFAKLAGVSYTLNEAGNSVTVNGKSVAVEMKEGVRVAHVRALAEAAGASDVVWDSGANTVHILYGSKLVVYGDTVSQQAGCMIQNRFTVGDSIVFRMTAINPLTGQLDESAKLQVHLSTGEVLDMHLGEHPPGVPGAEKFWTAKYAVTDETPKGTLNYYVTAETATAKGEYKPFNVMPSLLTIVAAEPTAPAEASAEAPE